MNLIKISPLLSLVINLLIIRLGGFFKGRKRGIFAVQVDEVEVSKKPVITKKDTITIPKALTTIYQQMRIAGNRERTIDSYNYILISL